MATLPRLVVLFYKENALVCKKYDGLRGYIKTCDHPEDIVKPDAKFQVERAKSAKGEGYVHIRSCLTNKYWRTMSAKDTSIVAAADKPNEDESKWDCTLFKPYKVPKSEKFSILHVQLVKPLGCSPDARKGSGSFVRVSQENNPDTQLTYMDWESLVILPRHVTFKGDNGKYLKAAVYANLKELKFSGDDYADKKVGNQIFYHGDGSISIKNNHFDKYWRAPDYNGRLQADASDTSSAFTRFWPVRVKRNDPGEKDKKILGNVIALRSLGHKNIFCSRWAADDYLSSAIPSMVKEAKLQVEEQAVSREIYNINYHLADARIYSKNVTVMATASALNGSQEDDHYIDLGFNYTETTSTTWNLNYSCTWGVSTNVTAGVPYIAEEKIHVSLSLSFSVDWSTTTETTKTLSTSFNATVPKRTKITVSLVGSKASCEVPFTYTMREVLVDGTVRTTTTNAGVFIGSNCYDFGFEVKEKSLDAPFATNTYLVSMDAK